MPRVELKFWVFHEEQLGQALTEYFGEALATNNARAESARAEERAIRAFLESPEAKKHIRGGRAR